MQLPFAAGDMRIATWSTKPNLVYVSSRSSYQSAEGGFDGTVAWTRSNEEGLRIVPMLQKQPGAFDPYEALARFDVRYIGSREKGGRKVEVLQMVDATGQVNTQYFDAET